MHFFFHSDQVIKTQQSFLHRILNGRITLTEHFLLQLGYLIGGLTSGKTLIIALSPQNNCVCLWEKSNLETGVVVVNSKLLCI